ncbi:MAG: AAC(3) family N-acetyltransferase [Anaerolineales bacterium]
METYRDFVSAFRRLGLGPRSHVIAHASLSAFGEVIGGSEAIVGALVATFESIMMPTFTTRTMIVPPVGPSDNAIDYKADSTNNDMADIFQPDMPADRSMGVVAETMRLHPDAHRSLHPILSFSGVNAGAFLEAQSIEEPLAPIRELAGADGDVLLLGVDNRSNVSIHFAAEQAGRRSFVRWALTPEGVIRCPNWVGCSDGFQAIGNRLAGISRSVQVGPGRVQAIPLRDLIHLTTSWLREEPLALLCDRPSCARCAAVRASVAVH